MHEQAYWPTGWLDFSVMFIGGSSKDIKFFITSSSSLVGTRHFLPFLQAPWPKREEELINLMGNYVLPSLERNITIRR